MVLFTSAAPGKKTAPKAAPRRRPQSAAQPQPPPPPPPPLTPTLNPTPIPTPTDVPAQSAGAEQPSSSNDIPSTKEPEQPVSLPVSESTVEQAQSESVPTVTTQPIAIPVPTPIVATSPQYTPIRLPEPRPAAPPTQSPSAPEPPREPTPTVVQSRDAHGVTSTDFAIAGAQQRLEDYNVAPDVEAASAEPETQAAPVEAPKSKKSKTKSARRVSTAQGVEAGTASGSASKVKPAPKRKARATADSTSDEVRPAKRSRRSKLTETSTPPPTDSQDPSTIVDTDAAEYGEPDAADDEAPTRGRRKQPTRKAADNKAKVAGKTKTKTVAGKETPRGNKRKATTKSLETIVDSDDENEVTDAVATPVPEKDQEDPDSAEDMDEGQAPRKRQKRSTTEPKPKRPELRKRKIHRPPVEGEEEEEQQEEDRGSDPELHEIDPTTVIMFDVSYDTYHGKMSERGRAMNEIDWEAEKAKRRAEVELIASGCQSEGPAEGAADGVVQSTEGADGTAEPTGDNAEGGEQAEGAEQDGAPAVAELAPGDDDDNEGGIGFIVDDDGNIIEDPTTLVVNRQADAMAASAADRPVEEINDLTSLNNRTTWMNTNRREPTDRVPLWKWKSDPWSEVQTDEFYDALRMFGTDFLIISKMFPPKTRRMIKAKFTREEKLDPQRINRALNGEETKKLDLDYYAQKTARDMSIFTKYDGLVDAEKKIGLEMKEKHAEIAAELATAAAQEEQRAAEKRIQDNLDKSKQVKKARKSKKAVDGFGGFGGGGGPDAVGDD